MSGEDDKTVWVGNLHEDVSEEMLSELFLQAGPLYSVKRPKDKASGRTKNFAFVVFQHSCSVAYAIALMNGITLYDQSLKVQSRYLQELQAKGLVSRDPGGVHTLDPVDDSNAHDEQYQGNQQRAPISARLQGNHQGASILGAPPQLSGNLANLPPHIVALAQQQMSMLNANQVVPLSRNPALNARLTPRNDRYGSINYERGYPNSAEPSHSHQQYGRSYESRGRMRQFDNKSMQAMKRQSEDAMTEQNSEMLAAIQDRQGRFDRMRDGDNSYDGHFSSRGQNRDNSYNNSMNSPHYQDTHPRQSNRNFRQQPYDIHESHHNRNQDRYEGHHSRNHDRHESHHSRNHNRQGSRNHDRHGSYEGYKRQGERNSTSRNYNNDYGSHYRR